MIAANVLSKEEFPDFDEETGILPKVDDEEGTQAPGHSRIVGRETPVGPSSCVNAVSNHLFLTLTTDLSKSKNHCNGGNKSVFLTCTCLSE